MTAEKPQIKPNNPNFSSGPCTKRPGWSVECLSDALIGRSHRSKEGKAKLKAVIEKHRSLLGIPSDYKIAIVPASDTGAVEMALWSVIDDSFGVDVLSWESFGKDVVLLVMILIIFAGQKYIKPFFSKFITTVIALLSFIACLGFAYHVLMHLPTIDFRPFKVGNNITEKMTIPEDAPQPVIEYTWTFKENGKEVESIHKEKQKENSKNGVYLRHYQIAEQ